MQLPDPEEPSGSKFEISLLYRMTISPPYCGIPRLSHQFPVVVEAGVVVGLDVEVIFVVDTGIEVET
jgi:hypothetical protein